MRVKRGLKVAAVIALGTIMSCGERRAGCLHLDAEPFGGGVVSLANPLNYSTKITGIVDDIGAFNLGGANQSIAAGDLNGDGRIDVVVGAPGADFNNRTNAGAAHVRFGAAAFTLGDSDLAQVANADLHVHGAFTGGAAGALGSAIAVGDLNGDGIADLVLGDATADANARANSGSVYILFGGPGIGTSIGPQVGPKPVRDLADTAQFNARFDGIVAADALGASVLVADVNGDGIGDLVMGCPGADALGRVAAGRVFVFFGRAAFPTGTIDLLTFAADVDYLGATAGDALGTTLAAGQIGGSALTDLAMGAPLGDGPADARADCGEVYIVFGSLALPAGAIDFASALNFSVEIIGSTAGDGLGRAIAIGDVNGGSNDIVIGAPVGNKAEVVFGLLATGVRDLNAAAAEITYTGAAAGDALGTSVAVGDHDTIAGQDVILGAPGHDTGGANAGAVYVISGGPGVAVGTRNVVATSGNYETRYDGAAAGDAVGMCVAMTNVNADAQIDLFMSAPTAEFTPAGLTVRTDGGIIYVRTAAGPSVGVENIVNLGVTPGAFQVRLLGAARGAGFAATFVYADVNGDGIQDVIVGAPNEDRNGRANSGTVYVIFGRAGLTTSQEITVAGITGLRFDGAGAGDRIGSVLIGMGDVNGDTIDDILLTSGTADNNARANSGSVYIIFGRTSWTQTIWDLAAPGGFDVRVDGELAGDQLGTGCISGDYDNDGIKDLVIGATFASFNARVLSGSTYVVLGRTSWASATIDLASLPVPYALRLDGATAFDLTGLSPAVIDLDGDSLNDLVFSAFFASYNGRAQSGSVYITYGRTPALSGVLDLAAATSYDVRLDGAVAGDEIGFNTFATDIDGDSRGELAIGAFGRDVGAVADAGNVLLLYGGVRLASGTIDLLATPIQDATVIGRDALGLFTSCSFARIARNGVYDIIASPTNSGSTYHITGWNNRFRGPIDLAIETSYQVRYDASHPANQLSGAYAFRASTDFSGGGVDDLVLIERLGDGAVWDAGAIVFLPTPE